MLRFGNRLTKIPSLITNSDILFEKLNSICILSYFCVFFSYFTNLGMESSIYLVTERKHDKVQEFLKLQLIQRKKRAVTLWKHYQTPELKSLHYRRWEVLMQMAIRLCFTTFFLLPFSVYLVYSFCNAVQDSGRG